MAYVASLSAVSDGKTSGKVESLQASLEQRAFNVCKRDAAAVAGGAKYCAHTLRRAGVTTLPDKISILELDRLMAGKDIDPADRVAVKVYLRAVGILVSNKAV